MKRLQSSGNIQWKSDYVEGEQASFEVDYSSDIISIRKTTKSSKEVINIKPVDISDIITAIKHAKRL